MNGPQPTLAGVLGIPEGKRLEKVVLAKADSPRLSDLSRPEAAMGFARANLRSTYLFARYTVPSYAAAVFRSLTAFHPTDDETGPVLARLAEAVQGELFNNNIFGRPGECHAHYHDAREAYLEAGGDGKQVADFEALARQDIRMGITLSKLWSPGAAAYAGELMRCCEDPLALFVLIASNELFTPVLYARVLASLCREGRFDALRRFLMRHVELDDGEHGPVTLEWLALHDKKAGVTPAELRDAVVKVTSLYGG